MSLPSEEEMRAGFTAEALDYANLDNPALLLLSRKGDTEAFAELYVRHRGYAIRVASRTSRSLDPEDVAAEAFARVWTALSHGRGPERAFCPYLAAAVRNVALNWHRGSHDVATDPVMLEIAEEDSTTTAIAEGDLIGEAFGTLPQRWQRALWAVDVEGTPVQEFADSSGLSANAASALCLRAREGLKAAWLQAHVHQRSSDPECQWVLERLGAHARPRLPASQRNRVDAHLFGCPRCRKTRERLSMIASSLRATTIFAGSGAAIWLAKSAGTAATTGVAAGAALAAHPAITGLGASSAAAFASASGKTAALTSAGKVAATKAAAGQVAGWGTSRVIMAGAASMALVAATAIGITTSNGENVESAAVLIGQTASVQPSSSPSTPAARALEPAASASPQVTASAQPVSTRATERKPVSPATKKPATPPAKKVPTLPANTPPANTPQATSPARRQVQRASTAPSTAVAPQQNCSACGGQTVVINIGIYAGVVTTSVTTSKTITWRAHPGRSTPDHIRPKITYPKTPKTPTTPKTPKTSKPKKAKEPQHQRHHHRDFWWWYWKHFRR